MFGWPGVLQPARAPDEHRARPRCRRPCRRSSPARAGTTRSAGRTARAPSSRRPTRRRSPGRSRRSRGHASSGRSRARDIATLKPSPISPSIASSGTSTSSSAQLRRVGAVQARACRGSRWSEKPSELGRRRGSSARPRCFELRVGLGEDQRDLARSCPARSTASAPVIDQPPSIFFARVLLVGGVGAGVGLGEAEAAERLAASRASAATACFCSSVPQLDDRRADERGLHRDDRAHRGVAAADLLDDQPVGEVVEAARRRTRAGRSRRGSPCRRSSRPARCRSARCGRCRGRAG